MKVLGIAQQNFFGHLNVDAKLRVHPDRSMSKPCGPATLESICPM